jgi:hypothetical protein
MTSSPKIQGQPFSWRLIEKSVSLFHVSEVYLGEKFVLTPRIPRTPYVDSMDNVIEDMLTPRVSLAPTLYRSYKALGGIDKVIGPFDSYVYGVPSDLEVITPWKAQRPNSPRNPYGPEFELGPYLRWRDSKGKEKLSPERIQELFRYLVPDVAATQELWSLKPTRVVFLGQTIDGEFYLASWLANKARKQKLAISKNTRPAELVGKVLDTLY